MPAPYFRPMNSGMMSDFDHIIDQLQRSGELVDATWDGPETKKLLGEKNTILHTHNVQQFSALWLRAIQQHLAQEM